MSTSSGDVQVIMADSEAHQSGRGTSEFRLANLARKRRRPLLLTIDAEGRALASSLPEDMLTTESELLHPALGEARRLVSRHLTDGFGQSCSLVLVDDVFYSVRLFPLRMHDDSIGQRQFAVLIEPVVDGSTEVIDFDKLKTAYRLSRREVDVLNALMSGSTDKQIARKLGLSASTARAYLKSVRAKLGVTTRTAVVNLVHQFSND